MGEFWPPLLPVRNAALAVMSIERAVEPCIRAARYPQAMHPVDVEPIVAGALDGASTERWGGRR